METPLQTCIQQLRMVADLEMEVPYAEILAQDAINEYVNWHRAADLEDQLLVLDQLEETLRRDCPEGVYPNAGLSLAYIEWVRSWLRLID